MKEREHYDKAEELAADVHKPLSQEDALGTGQPHPIREPAHHPRPHLQGKPRLSRPADPAQRDQPRP